MVTISCSCGAVTTARRHPLVGLGLAERLALVEAAFAVEGGFLTLEADASWHPAASDPDEACVVLVDLDAIDASAGLDDEDARRLRAALHLARSGGRMLPDEVALGRTRFRARPADSFRPQVTYVIEEAGRTLLEVTAEPGEPPVLGALVDAYDRLGPDAAARVAAVARRRSSRGRLAAALVELTDRAVTAA